MSDTSITLRFGDGSYRFWLPMARIVEAERACGEKSIVTIYDELGQALGLQQDTGDPVFLGGGPVRIRDVYEVIRCAAIGGNNRERNGEVGRVSPLEAKQLVDSYVDGRPLAESAPVAWAILNAAILGVDLKKKTAESVTVKPGGSRSAKVRSSPTADS